MNVGYANFRRLAPKSVTIATSLERQRSQKKGTKRKNTTSAALQHAKGKPGVLYQLYRGLKPSYSSNSRKSTYDCLSLTADKYMSNHYWPAKLCEGNNDYSVNRHLVTFIHRKSLPMPTVVTWEGFPAAFMCLSVCLFFHTISQKPMHLGLPNLT